ncbi:BTAD domain-containing putative transcriptional regulator [Longimycelium tulufanense]|uniref:BTAD domain-containing putative transcriptional regulator n=1 Tax=Longimycelium tulufanense TaxID=907463 RepID=UPI00166411E8|nr:BTAD domain-containing putative transcriptional regulator [Longimycelium tulufanense]
MAVSYEDRQVELGPARQRAVLAALLLAPGQVMTPEQLTEAVWPGNPPAEAMANLHSYVSNLRRRLEPNRPPRGRNRILRREPMGYLLAVEPDQVDAHRFEQLLGEGRRLLLDGHHREAGRTLQECMALWRGTPYVDVRDCHQASQEAVRLEELRLLAVETRWEAELSQGRDASTVAAELAALRTKYPIRERLSWLLMQALCRTGRQADALKVYDSTRRALAEELGVDPGPELQKLFNAILRGDYAAPASTPPSPVVLTAEPRPVPSAVGAGDEPVERPPTARYPLLERESELDLLTRWGEAALAGRGRVVLVRGTAGLGKTRLVQEWESKATAGGLPTFWGRCQEAVGTPFWPWVQVLRQLVRARRDELDALPEDVRSALARILPEMGLPDPGAVPQPRRVTDNRNPLDQYEAVYHLLHELASRHPFAIVLEGVHAADPHSRDLLDGLTALAHTMPLIIVVTERVPETGAQIEGRTPGTSCVRDTDADVLNLRPLSPEAVHTLVSSVAGVSVAEALGDPIYIATCGNPFQVSQLLAFLDETREPRLVTPSRVLTRLTAGVRDLLRHWLQRLDDDTRNLLKACAVAREDLDVALLDEVTQLGDETLQHLDLAIDCGLLREDPTERGRYRFAHALIQKGIDADLNGLERATLHARVGHVLANRGPGVADDVERVANHFWAARALVDGVEVLRHTERAAEHAAQRRAREDAQRWLRRSIEIARRLPPSDELMRRQVELFTALGQIAVTAWGFSANEAEKEFGTALDICEQRELVPPPVVLWGLCFVYFMSGRLSGVTEMVQRMLEQARATGDPAALLGASYGQGVLACLRGELDVAVGELSWAVGLADRLYGGRSQSENVSRWSDWRISCRAFEALCRWLLGEHDAASRLRIEIVAMPPVDAFSPAARLGALYFDAMLASFDGDVGQALVSGTNGLARAAEQELWCWHSMIRGPYGWALARTGEVAVGLSHLRGSIEDLQKQQTIAYLPLHLLYLADIQEWLGDERAARASAVQALTMVDYHGLNIYLHPRHPFRTLWERLSSAELAKLR